MIYDAFRYTVQEMNHLECLLIDLFAQQHCSYSAEYFEQEAAQLQFAQPVYSCDGPHPDDCLDTVSAADLLEIAESIDSGMYNDDWL